MKPPVFLFTLMGIFMIAGAVIYLNQPDILPDSLLATEPDSTDMPGTRTTFNKTVDALVNPANTPEQKNVLFEQLRQAGQLDQAIAEIKQVIGPPVRQDALIVQQLYRLIDEQEAKKP